VVVYAGDVPTYVGTPGRNGNARAVQVRGAWERGR
jgi:flagellar motor switch protein FliM